MSGTGFDTYGDIARMVLAAETEEAAIAVVAAYNSWLKEHAPKLKTPEQRLQLIQSNIGFCFGEGMSPERKLMWNKVCGASHPIFGLTSPTPEEAFKAGVKAGEQWLKEKERKGAYDAPESKN